MKVKHMIIVPLFSALVIIGSYIQIPIGPVPFTLQTLMVVLSGIILGSKLGMLSQLIYMLIGLIGLPVFSGGKGGFSAVVSPTFGFVISFILIAYISGKIIESSIKNLKLKIFLASFIGCFSSYIIGIPYFFIIFKYILSNSIPFYKVLNLTFIPFIIGDLIKVLVATLISISLMSIPYIRNFTKS
ncbi:biotin transporter BioY [Clostridium frigidicarnis]|uniref:Biotin transporter n=1 Tax=Clostridium frigidicarnis TaxID=84698 RepID=A0A1I0XXG7_9CLOT|nr:biotin transporter BioY [Clostridium frigidicarnis]SFB05745.1 biotin transport system substrate-specific component [Clostridium frigidicarnis]